LMCEQEREGARRIERWRTAEELLARAVHVVRAVALHDLERDRRQVIGDLPVVADVREARRRQSRAGDGVPQRRAADRVRQPRAVDRALDPYLELHAPRLVLAVEVEVELVEDVEACCLHDLQQATGLLHRASSARYAAS